MTTMTDETTLGGKPSEGTKKDKRIKQNKAEGDVESLADAPADAPAAQWSGVLVVEGVPTGDGRKFATDALELPDPSVVPMILQWQKETGHGSDHDVTVAVGRIDRVWREQQGDMNLIMGEGRFDTHPDALEAFRRMEAGMANGVSINADDIENAEIEYIWPEPAEGEEDDILSILFGGPPDMIIYNGGRLRGATMCDIPAFVEAVLHTITAGEAAAVTEAVTAAATVATHTTGVTDASWDAAINETRLPDLMTAAQAAQAFGWVGAEVDGQIPKTACRYLHHEISETGTPGDANLHACESGIGILNAGQWKTIPDDQRQGVYQHLAQHLRDAGKIPEDPDFPLGSLTAAAGWQQNMWTPERAWFEDPGIKVPTPIIVTDAGQVWGLATEWTECHLGYGDECVKVPREEYHDRFLTGMIPTTDGQVAVGQITAGISHAPLSYSSHAAAEHYDNTEAVVADVAMGNCPRGIWVAGAIRPFADPARVHALRASGQVSPDWRFIAGQLRMVGLLTVNVSGFQVPRVNTLVAGGQIRSMIASGFVSARRSNVTEKELDQRALRLLQKQLDARVYRQGV